MPDPTMPGAGVPNPGAADPGAYQCAAGANPHCNSGSFLGNLAADAAGGAIDAVVYAMVEGANKVIASVGSAWLYVPTPNLTSSGSPVSGVATSDTSNILDTSNTAKATIASTPSDAVGYVQGALWWYVLAAAVMAVIVGGTKMAWDHRAEPGRELLKAMLTLIVVSGASLTGIALAVTAADEFSTWIVWHATDNTDFAANLLILVGLTAMVPVLGKMLLIVIGLAVIVVSIVQIMLMVARGGMLVVLAGVLPLTASFTNTEMGRDWFKRAVAWLIAWIMYKPAAAIVYATAFRLIGSRAVTGDANEMVSLLAGVILMIMAVLALPALLRFVTPMVNATASGGGGQKLMAAAHALPTGAQAVGAARKYMASRSQSAGGDDASDATGSGVVSNVAQSNPAVVADAAADGAGDTTGSARDPVTANGHGGGNDNGGPEGAPSTGSNGTGDATSGAVNVVTTTATDAASGGQQQDPSGSAQAPPGGHTSPNGPSPSGSEGQPGTGGPGGSG